MEKVKQSYCGGTGRRTTLEKGVCCPAFNEANLIVAVGIKLRRL